MEKTFKTFLQKYNNQYVDFDGAYGAQCFDLVQYWSRYIGGHRFGGDYAYQIFDQSGSFYQKILNTPEAIPQAGDIIVWKKSYNGWAGHTGIATGEGDLNYFMCFQQNDPTGMPSRVVRYNYNHVLGWLRPKSSTPTDSQIIKNIKDIINSSITDTEFRNKCRSILKV